MDLDRKISELTERINSLETELHAMKNAPSSVRLTIAQLCQMLGISRFRLKTAYETYGLPMEPPYRKDGKQPTYSMADLHRIKQCLINLGEINDDRESDMEG